MLLAGAIPQEHAREIRERVANQRWEVAMQMLKMIEGPVAAGMGLAISLALLLAVILGLA